ncbi:MAG: hypothetical protein DRI44_05710 [Chlamydiae bacterium]|nr:MAG: hypothetical protein DRI44_05710 [Chlamydiota bacterium]
MNGKWHLLINTIAGLVLFIFCLLFHFVHLISPFAFLDFEQSWSDVPAILFAFIAAHAWCDIDQHVDWLPHRNWFTHSILICLPLIFVPLWWWQFPSGLFTFFVGLHLVCDCIKDPKKQKGYWNVALYKSKKIHFVVKSFNDRYITTQVKRMSRIQSLVWLEVNGIIGMILGLMVMII